MDELIYILIGWNIITFLLMAIDKFQAIRGKWRISESTLLTAAFAMGGIGIFIGSIAFRHKIRKMKFRILVPVALIFNLSVIYLIWYYVLN